MVKFNLSILTQDPIKNIPTLPDGQHAIYINQSGVPVIIGDLVAVNATEFYNSTTISGFSYEGTNMGGINPSTDTVITTALNETISNIKYFALYFGNRNIGNDTNISSVISIGVNPVQYTESYNLIENGWSVQTTAETGVVSVTKTGDNNKNLWILATVTDGTLNLSNSDFISFPTVSGTDLKPVPQMVLLSTNSIPVNCLGSNTPIVVSLDGKTCNISDLSETNVVVRDNNGNRELVKGKVYRTVIPNNYDSISIPTEFGIIDSAPTHLFFSKNKLFTKASINNSKCKRQCKKNNHENCGRCMPFKIKDYDSFVAVDLVSSGLATLTKTNDFLYHIILDRKYKNWAMELGDGSILSESFRHQYGDRDSDNYWIPN